MVNRTWHWLFGSGLVRTVDNFGTTGELPSHPELLDDLAVRFVEDGWSVKKLVREIVLSHTYRLADSQGGVGGQSPAHAPGPPIRRTGCSAGPTAAGSTPSVSATPSWPSAASSSWIEADRPSRAT